MRSAHLSSKSRINTSAKRAKARGGSSAETLERRVFLSGSVLAEVVQGNLYITGDAKGNVVVVNQKGLKPHQFRVLGDASTTINGKSGSDIVRDVRGEVLVRLGDGVDSVTLRGITFPQNAGVSQGGRDTLAISDVTVARSLMLRNSSSVLPMTSTVTNTTVEKDLNILSGDGGQHLALQSVEVKGATRIQTGKRYEVLTINDSIFHGAVNVSTGRGVDDVQIETNGSTSGPHTSFDGSTTIATGAGDDTLQLGEIADAGNLTTFADETSLDGGDGFDTLHKLNATSVQTIDVTSWENTAPTVASTNPIDAKTNFALNKVITATFSQAMESTTVIPNFTVTGPGTTPVGGIVTYDGLTKTATFTPTSNLAPSTEFTATIKGGATGAKDATLTALASDKVWTFTTGTQIAQAPIILARASGFAILATAAVSGSGNMITGDVGLHTGTSQGIPPSEITGNVHVNDQAVIDAQTDLLAAYDDAVSRTVTSKTLQGNMGGLTFTPGLYTNSTSVLISGAGPANNVTLDAQGDPNAIFIFKMGSTLTTGPGAQVILAGLARPENIFWQVGTSATIDTTTIFKGNILASSTITVNNGAQIVGRLLGGSKVAGSVTVNASSVTVPT